VAIASSAAGIKKTGMSQNSSVPSSNMNSSGLSATESSGPDIAGLAPPILLQYWQVVLRWKWVITGIIILALAIGLVVTLLSTPNYTATSRIEISRELKKVTNVEGIESADTGRDLEFYNTQYALLHARSLAERVARKLRLANNDAFFDAHGVDPDADSTLDSKAGGPFNTRDRQRRENLAIKLLLENSSISPLRGSALVDISYTSASPTLSSQIANTWTEQFILQSMDRRFASTSDARKFLEGRLAEYRTRLETAERELVGYAANKDIVALGSTKTPDGRTEVDRTLVSSDLEALNTALASATAERISTEARARIGTSGANAETLGNIAIGQMRQKRTELAADYAKMMVQFEPSYPAARAVAEQIRVLDASLAREESRGLEVDRPSITKLWDGKPN
jgi:polysaccharide biosynthesis transport protein